MASSVSDSTAPVIGISTYRSAARWGVWDREAALLPGAYIDAVSAAGGIPVLLPVLAAGAVEVVRRVDALVLAGGPDVDPTRYGAEPHERTTGVQPDRDAWENALLEAALERDLPVLAICRGAQVLNVARGGTLHQHLPDALEHENHQPGPARFGASPVTVAEDSRLASILGTTTAVRCYHHQALDALGDGVRAVAWAEDGTVEAVELTRDAMVLGVQWHPEENPEDLRLFEAVVQAAKTREPTPRSTERAASR